jgi:AcrR family transcriptional regulator
VSTLRNRAEQARVRREEILAAALTLFSRDGFAGTSTRRIADAAGINESLVFHYFPTKADLLVALATRRHTFAGRVSETLESAGNRPAQRVVRDIARALPTVLREEAELIGLLLSESHTNPELYAAVGATMDGVVAGLAGWLKSRRRELRPGVPLETAARGFLGGFLLFFLTHHRLGRASWERQATKFAAEWSQTWFAGVAAK